MKIKILSVMLSVFFISSCMRAPDSVSRENQVLIPLLIKDSLSLLVSLYPPAHTRFYFSISPKDVYGKALVRELRLKGYFISESKDSQSSIRFSYRLDRVGNNPIYGLRLGLNEVVLSRAYALERGRFFASGPWMKRG